ADGPGLERVGELTRAVAVLDRGRPELRWLFPELEGQPLVRGSAVRVRVTGFRVGSGGDADGHVRLNMVGPGDNCHGTVLVGDEDVSQGRGEVEFQLPARCSGRYLLQALLADANGVPVRPYVQASRGVDIP
ncbi:carboxypeptidase regulatory-like domain-containing protein, partial [Pyxidicoccus sp. 3LFB2]